MRAPARRTPPARQRSIVIAAAERRLSERGVQAVTVKAVCSAAKLPKASFDALYRDRGELLLDVFDLLGERIGQRLAVAYRGQEDWLSGVRAAILWLLDYLESEPQIARFLIVEATHEERIMTSRSKLMLSAAQALQAGAPAPAGAGESAPFGSEAVVATVVSVLHGRLLEEPPRALPSLAGALMGLIVLPFLGAEASREELSRFSAQTA